MEKFKAILSEALAKNLDQVMIEPGKKIIGNAMGKPQPMEQSPVDQAWISSIARQLLPEQAAQIDQGNAVQGMINAGKPGRVGVVLQEKKITIFLGSAAEKQAQMLFDILQASSPLGEGITSGITQFNIAPSSVPPGVNIPPPPNQNPPGFNSSLEETPRMESSLDPFDITAPPSHLESAISHPPKEEDDFPSFDNTSDDFGNIEFNLASPTEGIPKKPLLEPESLTITKYSVSEEETSKASEQSQNFGSLFQEMARQHASDLLLAPNEAPLMRIDGVLMKVQGPALSPEVIETWIDGVISAPAKSSLHEQGHGTFSFSLDSGERLRCSIAQGIKGLTVSIRLIPAQAATISELGLPEVFTKLASLTKGLVIVGGARGTGKSSTMAALISAIVADRPAHVLTIEDPIEHLIDNAQGLATQMELGLHCDSFAHAIEGIAAQDIDVICLGDLKDAERFRMALELADCGYLVLATLKTVSVNAGLHRLMDYFTPEQHASVRALIATHLRVMTCQTLCRSQSSGRMGAFEILVNSEGLTTLLKENRLAMLGNYLQTQQALGNMPLNESLLNLVAAQTVSIQEAWTHAYDKKDFEEGAKRRRILPKVG